MSINVSIEATVTGGSITPWIYENHSNLGASHLYSDGKTHYPIGVNSQDDTVRKASGAVQGYPDKKGGLLNGEELTESKTVEDEGVRMTFEPVDPSAIA